MTFRHYIFGYGSLICPASRARTAPTLFDRVATPARVKHLERSWSLPVQEYGMTFIGVRERHGADCVGVLVPVNEEELDLFDVREAGYNRVEVDAECIHPVPIVDNVRVTDTGEDYCYFYQRQQSIEKKGAVLVGEQPLHAPTVWVYVQRYSEAVGPQCPIAQTYVDVILRGCLTISEDFAKQFLITTKGWHPHDFTKDSNERTEENVAGENPTMPPSSPPMSVHWVNDRNNPLYVRADIDYSRSMGPHIDRLLDQIRPEFVHRKPFLGRGCTL